MILKLIEKYMGESFGKNRLGVVWSPTLPQDLGKLVATEQTLVQNGIHSRRRAMDEVGVEDPETEFSRWLEEREIILKMNREQKMPARGGARERSAESRAESGEDI